MGKRKYTDEIINEAINLYIGGLSAKIIGRELNIPVPTIECFLKRNKVTRHSRVGLGIGRKHSDETKNKISQKHRSSGHRPTKKASDKGRIETIRVRWGRHKKDPILSVYNSYMRSASRRAIDFLISFEEFYKLISASCYYCGDDPRERIICNLPLKANGIDRVNSNIGYILENCVPCCTICNFMKMKLSEEIFIKQCEKIITYKRSLS